MTLGLYAIILIIELGIERGDTVKLSDVVRLDHRISIFVPSQQKDGTAVPNRDSFLLSVCDSLTGLCGGVTVTEGFGVWKDSQGTHVRESVSIAESFTDSIDSNKAAAVLALAVKLKEDMKQESLAFRLDNSLFLA